MPLSGASRQLTNTPSNGWSGMQWNRRKSTRFSARWQQGKRSLYRPYFPRVSLVKGAHHNGVQEAVSSTLATRTKQGPSDQPVKRTVKRKFHGPFAMSGGIMRAAWHSAGSGLYSLRIEYVLNSENQSGIDKADFASKIYNHIF